MNKTLKISENIKLPQVLGWGWLHWLLIGVVIFICTNEIYQRQSLRIKKVDVQKIDVIEKDIKEYNTMAERLAGLDMLPPVRDQWSYALAIAKRYGVDLKYQANADKYRGPLEAWGGRVSGSTGAVLVVAKEIQETVPTYLYEFNLRGGTASFEFAVLGSE
ncbi:MAG: hypothetical protein MI976_21245 [Pseudomonadales bacterium]|nr:hypothetical protein [Pseudomonadales bacterium]